MLVRVTTVFLSTRSSRTITLTQTAEGLPFSVAGGNAVGLFVMDVQTPGVVPGDQIMQVRNMHNSKILGVCVSYKPLLHYLKLNTTHMQLCTYCIAIFLQ